MRVYVYCPRNSTSARDLTLALRATEVETRRARTEGQLETALSYLDRNPGLLISWGEKMGQDLVAPNRPVLNRNPFKDKLLELTKLRESGVLVPEFRQEVPQLETREVACGRCVCATAHFTRVPAPQGEWLGRKRVHQSANDLLRPDTFTPDFYVKKLDVIEEFRVHVFKGKSIRTGKKAAHANAHPWIRSGESGWWIDYGQSWRSAVSDVNRANLRNAAKAAVAALGLDFGAVDLGRTSDGRIVVFEVNTAPSLSTPNTAAAYAKAIKEFINGLA